MSMEEELSKAGYVIPNFHDDKEIKKEHYLIDEKNLILLMKMKIILQ